MAPRVLSLARMELWQVKKQYRLLAVSLRRNRWREDASLDELEAQLLETLLRADRLDTELSLLRIARRCAVGRLKRTRKWLEGAVLMRGTPRPLARKSPFATVQELARHLDERALPSASLRQVMQELTSVEQRLHETLGRLAQIAVVADQQLQRLVAWVRVYREPADRCASPLEGTSGGG